VAKSLPQAMHNSPISSVPEPASLTFSVMFIIATKLFRQTIKE
jgi:hypothetical protein